MPILCPECRILGVSRSHGAVCNPVSAPHFALRYFFAICHRRVGVTSAHMADRLFFFIPSFVANHLEGPIHRVSRSRLVGTKSGRLPIFLRAPTATVFQALVLLIVGRKPLVEMCLRSGFLVGHQWNSVNPAVIFCHQDQKPSKTIENHRKTPKIINTNQKTSKTIENQRKTPKTINANQKTSKTIKEIVF